MLSERHGGEQKIAALLLILQADIMQYARLAGWRVYGCVNCMNRHLAMA